MHRHGRARKDGRNDGPAGKVAATPAADLDLGESSVAWALAVLMLVLGVAPTFWLNTIGAGAKPPVAVSTPAPVAISFAPEVKR